MPVSGQGPHAGQHRRRCLRPDLVTPSPERVHRARPLRRPGRRSAGLTLTTVTGPPRSARRKSGTCRRLLPRGVAVLLKIYAHCIDGQATAANERIADALGIRDAEPDLGDEDDDTEQAS
jgi:hypothetical protein